MFWQKYLFIWLWWIEMIVSWFEINHFMAAIVLFQFRETVKDYKLQFDDETYILRWLVGIIII